MKCCYDLTFLFSLLRLERVVSEEVSRVGIGWALWPVAGRGATRSRLIRRHTARSHRVRRHVIGRNVHWPALIATHIIWWTVGSGSAHVRVAHHVVVHWPWRAAHLVWIATWRSLVSSTALADHSRTGKRVKS